nr:hypothetical protein CFP56_23126 [Quercus suber]
MPKRGNMNKNDAASTSETALTSTTLEMMNLFGKYEVRKLLGYSAFVKVYHAWNVRTGPVRQRPRSTLSWSSPKAVSSIDRAGPVQRRSQLPVFLAADLCRRLLPLQRRVIGHNLNDPV